jgi:hypothetical protein
MEGLRDLKIFGSRLTDRVSAEDDEFDILPASRI